MNYGQRFVTLYRRQGSRPYPVAQMVKHLLATQETWVQSLGQEDFLEKEMATHSSFLAWKIPWTEEPGELQSMRSQESDMEKKCKKAKWLSEEALQIAERRREVKSKGERERYPFECRVPNSKER